MAERVLCGRVLWTYRSHHCVVVLLPVANCPPGLSKRKITFSPDVESGSESGSESEEGGSSEDDGEGPALSPRVCAPVKPVTIIHTAEADMEYKRQLAVLKQGAVGSSPPVGFVGTIPAPAPSTRGPAAAGSGSAKLASAVAAAIAAKPTPIPPHPQVLSRWSLPSAQ